MRRLAVRLNEVRDSHDLILFVIFDYIGLLDYRYEIFGMANLSLETLPDLGPVSVLIHQG